MPSSGYLSLLYSVRKKPLRHWSKHQSRTGRVHKLLDSDLLEDVVELQDLQKSSNSNTFITCPACTHQFLEVNLPCLVIIIKNMSVECSFRVQIIDTDQNRHHFNFSNEPLDKNKTILTPVISRVQVNLEKGWNRVEIDLEDLTQRVFQSRYKATQRLAIFANCRLRRVYFVDKHYDDVDTLPELCQAFFDHYMIKRGIQMSKKLSSDKNITTKNRSQFLRDLQIKSTSMINDFFTSTSTRFDNKNSWSGKVEGKEEEDMKQDVIST